MSTADADQYGCKVEAVGSAPLVDIVCVHGLNGHPRLTWTATRASVKKPLRGVSKLIKRKSVVQQAHDTSQASVFWPVDLLAKDVSNLRIISFGYDADVSKFLSRTSDRSMFSVAQDLVVRLEMLRDSTGLTGLPIIFVGHSLGGIVVKDALKFSQDQKNFQSHLFSIFECAYGVIFFGTPHRGSEMASIGRIAARIAGIGLAESNQTMLRSLELGSSELQRVSDAFSRMMPKQEKGLQIYSLLEGLPLTPFCRRKEDYSSIIGDENEGKATIQANHMDMCRFYDRANSDYQLVSGIIRRWSRMAPKSGDSCETVEISATASSSSHHQGPSAARAALPQINLRSRTRIPLELPQMPSRHICGRDQEILHIKRIFYKMGRNDQRILAVHGLGGVGKTQLCLSYVLHTVEEYSAVFWINSTSEQTIYESFRQIAQALVDWAARIQSEALNFSRIAFDMGLSQMIAPMTGEVVVGPGQFANLVKAVVKWLERPENSNWLMVFDSADDLEGLDLQAYFPHASHGDVIVSSRRLESALLGVGLEVKCLEQQVGRDLLLSQANLEKDIHSVQCQIIADTLGHLPLALAQAGSYMAATNTNPDKFLELYRVQHEIVLRHKPPTAIWQYKETVFTTWDLSFSAISKHHPNVAKLLLLLALMQPDDIWTSLFTLGLRKDCRRQPVWERFWNPSPGKLRKMFSKLGLSHQIKKGGTPTCFQKIHWLEELVSEPAGIKGAFSILASYSLIYPNTLEDGISIHPLVREWGQYQGARNSTTHASNLIILFGRVLDLPEGLESPEAAVILRRLSTHIPPLLVSIRHIEKNWQGTFSVDLCHALEALGDLFGARYFNHQFSDRLYVNKLAFEQTSKCLGLNNQITLVVLGNLALALEDCKLYDDAVRLAQQRSDLTTKLLGPLHYDSRDAMNDLAKALQVQGKSLQHARKVHELSLQRHKQATGNYVDGIQTVLNLRMLLLTLDELDQAHELLEEGIRILQALERWQLLLEAYGFLALVATAQGHVSEALNHVQSAIAVAEQHWGHHSEQALEWRGVFAEHAASILPLNDESTLDHIETAFSEWEKIYADRYTRHVDRNRMRTAKANFYYDFGQNMKAIDIFQEEINSLKHSNTAEAVERRLRMLNELGMTYWDYGLLTEAVDTYDQALQYENDDSFQRTLRLNKAVALRDMGRLDDSETLLRTSVDIQSSNYASLDYTNLASIFQARGQYVEAKQMYERVIADMQTQPSMGSSLLLTRHRYAELSSIMGNHEEAIDIFSEVFNEKIGICRSATLKTGISLYSTLMRTGRKKEAAETASHIRPFLQYS